MAGKAKIGASIVLDGEKEYREAVAKCNRENAKLRSEMSLLKEQYAGAANSSDALSKKQEVLTKMMQQALLKTKETDRALQNAKGQRDKVKTALEELNRKYADEKKKLETLNGQEKVSNTTIEKQKKLVEQLSAAINKGNANYSTAEKRVSSWETKLNTARAQQEKMSRSVAENKKYLGEAKNAIDNCAYSIDQYGKKSKETEAKTAEAFSLMASHISSSGMKEAVEDIANTLMDCSEAAAAFETASDKVSTLADTSVKSMQQTDAELLQLSSESGKAVGELQETAYQALSASTSTADMLDVVTTSTKAATGGFATADVALDGLTTVINSYGDKVKDAAEVSDTFIAVQNLGKTTFGELGSSIGKVATNAANYNVGLADLGTAYIELTKRGVQTAEATTYTNSMLKELGKSSSEVSKTLDKKTNKKFAQLMESGKSLGDVLGILYDSVGRDNTAFMNMWSSQEAATAAVTMLKNGTEGYNETLKKVQKTAGATDTAYQTMIDNTEHASETFANNIENIKILVGKELNESLRGVYEVGSDISVWVQKFIEKHPELVRVITSLTMGLGTLTVATSGYVSVNKVLIPLIKALWAAMTANPVVAITTAIAALITTIGSYIVMSKNSKDAANQETSAVEKKTKAYEENRKERRKDIQESVQSVKNINTEVNNTENLIERLIQLNKVQKKTAGQKAEIKGIVDSLKTSIPELAAAYDEESGAVKLTENQVQKLVLAYKKQAIAKGMAEQITEATKALAESKTDLVKAENDYNDAHVKRLSLEAQANVLTDKAISLQKKFEDGEIGAAEYYAAVDAANAAADAYEKAKKNEKSFGEQVNKCKKEVDDNNKTVEIASNLYNDHVKEAEKEERAQKKVASATKKAADQYASVTKAYQKAEQDIESIGGKTSKKTKQEFDNAVKIAKSTGTKIPKGLAQGLKSGEKSPDDVVKSINDAVVNNLTKLAKKARQSGVAIPKEITDGMKNGTLSVSKASKLINDQIDKQSKTQQKNMKKAYVNVPKDMKSAFEKGGTDALDAIKQSKEKIKALEEEAGVSSVDGLLKGLNDNKARVVKAYEDLGKAANSGFKKELGIHSPSRVMKENGEYTVAGIVDGMQNKKKDVQKVSSDIGTAVDESIRSSLDIHSPSKKTEKSGENAGAGLTKGLKGSQKNVKKAANELGQKIISALDNKIEMKDLRTNGHGYSKTTITKMWKDIVKATKKGTQAHKDALKQYYTARNEMLNAQKEKEEKYQEKIKTMQSKLKEIRANYKETVKDLQSQMAEIKKEYTDAVNDTASGISSSWGLFAKASSSKTNNADGLIRNMKSQADMVKQWKANMDTLRKRGVSGALLSDLESAGVSSAGDVSTLAAMSDAQLKEYKKYYSERNATAKQEAVTENAALQKSTQASLAALQKTAQQQIKQQQKQLQNLQKQYRKMKKSVASLDKSTQKQMKQLGKNVSSGFAKGIASGSEAVYAAIAKMTGTTVKQVKKNLGIHSPSRVMAQLGGYTGAGFAQGLEKETQNLHSIILNSLPEKVQAPAVSTAQVQSNDANMQQVYRRPVELTLMMDSRAIAEATFDTVDLLTGGKITLKKRGLAL